MEQVEPSHEEGEEDREVMFREDDPRVGSPIPPIPITIIDMEVIIKGWERAGAALRGNARGSHGVPAEM